MLRCLLPKRAFSTRTGVLVGSRSPRERVPGGKRVQNASKVRSGERRLRRGGGSEIRAKFPYGKFTERLMTVTDFPPPSLSRRRASRDRFRSSSRRPQGFAASLPTPRSSRPREPRGGPAFRTTTTTTGRAEPNRDRPTDPPASRHRAQASRAFSHRSIPSARA